MTDIIDKLNFYIGFLDDFKKRAEYILKNNDYHSLCMLREYMIVAIKEIKEYRSK